MMFKKQHGFTLLEILIALTVLAIALTAIIRALIEDEHIETYLQQKTFAHVVANYQLNYYRYLTDISPNTKNLLGQSKGKIHMFNQDWLWQVNIEQSKNPFVMHIETEIRSDESSVPLAHLQSFISDLSNQ